MMKKGYIRPAGEDLGNRQAFGIFAENVSEPVTTHICSNEGYAEYDLLRHNEAKEFDVIYGLKGNIVYMKGEIKQEVKDKFNDAENKWRINKYGITAPINHTS